MMVTCWCARIEVDVPAHKVAEGETASCGRTICDPDKDRYNWRELFRKQPTRAAVVR